MGKAASNDLHSQAILTSLWPDVKKLQKFCPETCRFTSSMPVKVSKHKQQVKCTGSNVTVLASPS